MGDALAYTHSQLFEYTKPLSEEHIEELCPGTTP